jgi:molybdate transport system ATP-binding protein
VRQNIAFGLQRGWRNPARHSDHETVRYWLAALELGMWPDRCRTSYRAANASAWHWHARWRRPRALLLDEPFAALDPALRQRMRAELDRLQRQLAIPMLLITHDRDDVEAFGDHAAHGTGAVDRYGADRAGSSA